MADQLNHHNDPTGLLQSAKQASAPNYLGNLELVDRLVRSFVADIMTRFDEVSMGRMVPNDAAAADQADCFKMADIFAGKDQRFAPVPGWNGKALADFIRQRMYSAVQGGEDDHSVIAQAFAVLAHHVYEAIRADADENKMIDQINDAVRSLAWTLHGIEVNE